MRIYDPSAPPPPPEEAWQTHPVTLVTHLVVVPAAVIAMVAALLFYLVDVRSAFLGGGPALKWVGLCFATATVLIERYRRSSGDADLQGCYKIALAGATLLVLLVEPWETRPSGLGGKLANLLIVAVAGLFATGITRGLSPEIGRGATVPPNPAATVARLAALALLAFALGEPTLLAAAPQTGERALAAVVVFLLATGVTLAAGSSMGTLRRVEKAGGLVSQTLVPGRMAIAALLMAAVLAAALAVPGIEVRGTGRLRPPPAPGVGSDTDHGFQVAEPSTRLGPRAVPRPPPVGRSARPLATGRPIDDRLIEESGDSAGELVSRDTSQILQRALDRGLLPGPAAPFLGALASLGKWLLVPLALALVAASLYAFGPRFASWGGRTAERWRAVLAGLAGRFRRRGPGRASDPGPDPLEDLDRLAHLSARDAVLASYHVLLATCGRRGHPRPARSTPYEFLDALPPELRSLEHPARILTELYVNAAYGPGPVPPEDRSTALAALAIVRGPGQP